MHLGMLRRTAKRDVGWFLVCLFGLQIAFVMVVDRSPGLYDPEYGVRLGLLHKQVESKPDCRLLVAVGSSRIGCGFTPEVLPALKTASGEEVLPFNASHLAAGPVCNLVALQRLLREGFRPDWLLLEFLPLAMYQEGLSGTMTATAAGDLPVLVRHAPPVRAVGIYLRSRLNPFFKHRQAILDQLAPSWRTSVSDKDWITLRPLGGNDGWTQEATVSAAERLRRTQITQHNDSPRLKDWRLSPASDRALRETLQLCREQGIDTALIVMPISRTHQSWFAAESSQRMRDYLAELTEAYGVRLIDAQDWLPEEQHYADSHHLLRASAERFTRELGDRVLKPWLAGETPPELLTGAARRGW